MLKAMLMTLYETRGTRAASQTSESLVTSNLLFIAEVLCLVLKSPGTDQLSSWD